MMNFNNFSIDKLKEMVYVITDIIDNKKRGWIRKKRKKACKNLINDSNMTINYMGYNLTFVQWLEVMVTEGMIAIDTEYHDCEKVYDMDFMDYEDDETTVNTIVLRKWD